MSVDHVTKQAKALGLVRQVRLSERAGLWLLLFILAAAGLVLAFVLVAQGRFANIDPDLWGSVLRGYSGFGEILGILAAAFAGLSFLFSLRKRLLQERFVFFRSTMMAWLWVHVVAGLLCLLAATLHAGFGLLDYKLTTGKVLYWLLIAVSATGVLWRLVYYWVPRSVAPKIGNYSKSISDDRATEQALEIEKLAAGRSEALRQWKDWLLQAPRTVAELATAQQHFAGSAEEADFAALCELASSRNRAIQRAALQKKPRVGFKASAFCTCPYP